MRARTSSPSRTHLLRQRDLPIRLVVGPGVRRVDVQQDVDEEVQEEGDRVQDQDVRDVGDVCGGEEGHLFFCCAHEEEAGGVEELDHGLVSIDVCMYACGGRRGSVI